ncbi:hypothetical protein GW17_00006367 [Ensete ventricosum]|nr:hypothetical protein GW17_00006367 [Ensete ventricosum]
MGGRALCPHAAPLLAPPLCGLAAAKRYPLWAGRGQLSLLAAMNVGCLKEILSSSHMIRNMTEESLVEETIGDALCFFGLVSSPSDPPTFAPNHPHPLAKTNSGAQLKDTKPDQSWKKQKVGTRKMSEGDMAKKVVARKVGGSGKASRGTSQGEGSTVGGACASGVPRSGRILQRRHLGQRQFKIYAEPMHAMRMSLSRLYS